MIKCVTVPRLIRKSLLLNTKYCSIHDYTKFSYINAVIIVDIKTIL